MLRSIAVPKPAAAARKKQSRRNAPGAATITWKGLETIGPLTHSHIGNARELIKRAGSKALAGWGRADQELPDL